MAELCALRERGHTRQTERRPTDRQTDWGTLPAAPARRSLVI